MTTESLAAAIYSAHERIRAEYEDGPQAVWVPWEAQTSRRERRIYFAVAKEVLRAIASDDGGA